ncbi:hypothetical protein [Lacrimispora sp.]|uniref:hypothetical protein n=1 Tax=Lacrimispora sp. TaxID=2719234 RepID=UPI002897A881|nr:hypothetical protein [Lacrimispora sp.]
MAVTTIVEAIVTIDVIAIIDVKKKKTYVKRNGEKHIVQAFGMAVMIHAASVIITIIMAIQVANRLRLAGIRLLVLPLKYWTVLSSNLLGLSSVLNRTQSFYVANAKEILHHQIVQTISFFRHTWLIFF